MDDFQTYEFIEMVQAEEALWNICHKDFKDTAKKSVRWTQIGSAFNMSGDEAYSKFRSLREKYRREKNKLNDAARSGAAAFSGSRWPFMTHMQFVDECYKRRKVFNSNEWKIITTPGKKPTLPSSVPGTTSSFRQQILFDTSLASPPLVPRTSPSIPTLPHPSVPSSPIFSVATTVPSSIAALPSSPVSTHSPSPVPVLSPPVFVPSPPVSVPTPPVSLPSPSPVFVPSPSPNSILSPSFIRTTSSSSGSTPSPFTIQVPPPSNTDDNATPAGLKRKSNSSLEQALSYNTEKTMEMMKSIVNKESPQPYECVVQFIRQTLIEIGAERAKEMEKELMEIAFKYKYN